MSSLSPPISSDFSLSRHRFGSFLLLDEFACSSDSPLSLPAVRSSRSRAKKHFLDLNRCFIFVASSKRALKNPNFVIDLKGAKIGEFASNASECADDSSAPPLVILPRSKLSGYVLHFLDWADRESWNAAIQARATLYNILVEQEIGSAQLTDAAPAPVSAVSLTHLDPSDAAALLDSKQSALSLLEREYQSLDRQVSALTEQTLTSVETVKSLKKQKKLLASELVALQDQIHRENSELASLEQSYAQMHQARKMEKAVLLNSLTFGVGMLAQLFHSSPAVLQASKYAQKRAELKLKHGLLGTPQTVNSLDNPALLMLCNLELNEIYREIAAFRNADSALQAQEQRSLHQALAAALESNAAVRVQVNAFGHKFDELTIEKLKRKETQFELKQAVANVVSGATPRKY